MPVYMYIGNKGRAAYMGERESARGTVPGHRGREGKEDKAAALWKSERRRGRDKGRGSRRERLNERESREMSDRRKESDGNESWCYAGDGNFKAEAS